MKLPLVSAPQPGPLKGPALQNRWQVGFFPLNHQHSLEQSHCREQGESPVLLQE